MSDYHQLMLRSQAVMGNFRDNPVRHQELIPDLQDAADHFDAAAEARGGHYKKRADMMRALVQAHSNMAARARGELPGLKFRTESRAPLAESKGLEDVFLQAKRLSQALLDNASHPKSHEMAIDHLEKAANTFDAFAARGPKTLPHIQKYVEKSRILRNLASAHRQALSGTKFRTESIVESAKASFALRRAHRQAPLRPLAENFNPSDPFHRAWRHDERAMAHSYFAIQPRDPTPDGHHIAAASLERAARFHQDAAEASDDKERERHLRRSFFLQGLAGHHRALAVNLLPK